MNYDFTYFAPPKTGAIVVPVFENGFLGTESRNFDTKLGDAIRKRLDQKSFDGNFGKVLTLSVDEALGAKEIILLGMGKGDDMGAKEIKALSLTLAKAIKECGEDSVHFLGRDLQTQSGDEMILAKVFDAMQQNEYKFNKYKSTTANDNATPTTLKGVVQDWQGNKIELAELSEITNSANWAKDLGNEPPNKLTPQVYAKRITDELQQFNNVKVRTLDVADMEALKMGGALAVNQGSTKNPGCMVVIEYDGTNGVQDKPYGLVGKGVTFDTGGYNLKPGGSMADMKTDMCGSAAVVGTMRSLAARGANTKVVAVVGLVENMVDGNAFRPSDIITMMNGMTVEIGNTDAEGRLVLADAITYIQQEYDPKFVLDFATLTGAMVMALADTYTGVFSNDDALSSKIIAAGNASGELGWSMPVMHEAFSAAVKGSVSDLSNTGKLKGAGASTAAAFLKSFVDEGRPWAHFDIAGTSSKGGSATGVGVRWMDELFAANFEAANNTPALQHIATYDM